MRSLYFVTSNLKKVRSLERVFDLMKIRIAIEPLSIDLVEPQYDSVRAVSYFKAKQAYEKVRRPLVVEDGGFQIDALEGFPGPYTKYILKTIGIEGILKLMQGVDNRCCKLLSTMTYVDDDGAIHQFGRSGLCGKIAMEISAQESDIAWSDFWKIFEVSKFGKSLSELTSREINDLWSDASEKNSMAAFAEWLKKTTQEQSIPKLQDRNPLIL